MIAYKGFYRVLVLFHCFGEESSHFICVIDSHSLDLPCGSEIMGVLAKTSNC
jgi:hypothetical protein